VLLRVLTIELKALLQIESDSIKEKCCETK
jgi:hypothetical protein